MGRHKPNLIGPAIFAAILGVVIWTMCNFHYRGSYNQKPELLDAMILVNEHDGLSDWGLEQMDLLLDQAGYDHVPMN